MSKGSEAVSRRRKKLRALALNQLGGKCFKCGYNRCEAALHFHHLRDKKFGISQKGLTRSWTAIEKELAKCVLLCANCHAEEHWFFGGTSIEQRAATRAIVIH